MKQTIADGAGLYVVATPIGNLDDMSARAISVLKAVDLIVAEDTRTSKKLMRYFDIKTSIQSYHEHSSKLRTVSLLNRLNDGARLALISDAGTPLISDPGYFLLEGALTAGVPVFSVPGPSALSAALAVCGLPLESLVFEGFLASTHVARAKKLRSLRTECRTMVFFEAPHRLASCLQDMRAIFGASRRVSLVREISKIYESVHRCTLDEASTWLSEDTNRLKGEHVVVLEGATTPQISTQEHSTLLSILMEEVPLSRAVRLAAKISGARHSDLYRTALKIDKTSCDKN